MRTFSQATALAVALMLSSPNAYSTLSSGRRYHKCNADFRFEGDESARFVVNLSSDNITQLMRASYAGDLFRVAAELKKGDVNARSKSQWNALMFAAAGRHPRVVKFLVDHGASTGRTEGWWSPLMLAGDKISFRIMGGYPSYATVGGIPDPRPEWTPVSLAVLTGNAESLTELLKYTDVNTEDHWGSTPLIFASALGDLDIMKLLVDRGAKLDQRGFLGTSPVLAAVEVNDTRAVNFLLRKGAGAEQPDEKGDSPLDVAAQMGNEAIVRLLIDHGANVSSTDQSDGWTPLMHAATSGNVAITELLLSRGAPVDPLNNCQEESALMVSIKRFHPETARMLIAHGADINQRDSRGWTQLMRSSYDGSDSIVRMLVDLGADLDLTDNFGDTALTLSARYDHANITQWLIQHGADTSIRTKQGYTALDLARMMKHPEIVKILSEHSSK